MSNAKVYFAKLKDDVKIPTKRSEDAGFVNLLDTRYQNVEKAKSFFSKFDAIRYNKDKEWFEFNLDYDKFGKKAEGTRTKWTLCTRGMRIDTFRNKEKNSQWNNSKS